MVRLPFGRRRGEGGGDQRQDEAAEVPTELSLDADPADVEAAYSAARRRDAQARAQDDPQDAAQDDLQDAAQDETRDDAWETASSSPQETRAAEADLDDAAPGTSPKRGRASRRGADRTLVRKTLRAALIDDNPLLQTDLDAAPMRPSDQEPGWSGGASETEWAPEDDPLALALSRAEAALSERDDFLAAADEDPPARLRRSSIFDDPPEDAAPTARDLSSDHEPPEAAPSPRAGAVFQSILPSISIGGDGDDEARQDRAASGARSASRRLEAEGLAPETGESDTPPSAPMSTAPGHGSASFQVPLDVAAYAALAAKPTSTAAVDGSPRGARAAAEAPVPPSAVGSRAEGSRAEGASDAERDAMRDDAPPPAEPDGSHHILDETMPSQMAPMFLRVGGAPFDAGKAARPAADAPPLQESALDVEIIRAAETIVAEDLGPENVAAEEAWGEDAEGDGDQDETLAPSELAAPEVSAPELAAPEAEPRIEEPREEPGEEPGEERATTGAAAAPVRRRAGFGLIEAALRARRASEEQEQPEQSDEQTEKDAQLRQTRPSPEWNERRPAFLKRGAQIAGRDDAQPEHAPSEHDPHDEERADKERVEEERLEAEGLDIQLNAPPVGADVSLDAPHEVVREETAPESAAPFEADHADRPSDRALDDVDAPLITAEDGATALDTVARGAAEDDADEEEGLAPPMEEQVRMVEAMLFASETPLSTAELGARMPLGCDPAVAVRRLEETYATRGVRMVRVAGKWAFRTAPDLAYLMTAESVETRKLSKAAIETLAIVAYHQPVTRAEIEEIRQVSVSKGTLDLLMELEWIKLGRRRQTPGRPVTFITTDKFLDHFGLESTKDLPGLDELRQAGLLESRPGLGGPLLKDGEEEIDEEDGPEDDAEEDEADRQHPLV